MTITVRDIMTPAKFCVCEKCRRSWISILGHPPERCPNRACRTREWNGPKRRSHANEIALPAPRGRGRPKTGDDTRWDDGMEFEMPTSLRFFSRQ